MSTDGLLYGLGVLLVLWLQEILQWFKPALGPLHLCSLTRWVTLWVSRNIGSVSTWLLGR